MMLELYGGGYINALLQTSFTYYIACIVLHWVAPALLPVQNIQVQSRQPGQVTREAIYSLGKLPEELMHSHGSLHVRMHENVSASIRLVTHACLCRSHCSEGSRFDYSGTHACHWFGQAV